jgi:hypothetical protein
MLPCWATHLTVYVSPVEVQMTENSAAITTPQKDRIQHLPRRLCIVDDSVTTTEDHVYGSRQATSCGRQLQAFISFRHAV